jgi:hypothetical protein
MKGRYISLMGDILFFQLYYWVESTVNILHQKLFKIMFWITKLNNQSLHVICMITSYVNYV